MTAEQRMRELPGAIVQWYEIGKKSRIACLVSEYGNSIQVAESLENRCLSVSRIALAELEDRKQEKGELSRGGGRYDIVIAADILEYAQDPAYVLHRIRMMLEDDGRFLLAADNRLGIRYFCGDQDTFTGKNYDSVENYVHLLPWERGSMKGRAYSRAELTRYLEEAGFFRHQFYSVFPRISNPQLLLAQDYVPNEALDIRIFPEYNSPDTIFLMEEELYPSLMENGMLHGMANGFLVECPLKGEPSPICQVTLSGERGPENAMATVIRSDGTVEKRALYHAGEKKIRQLYENDQYLSAHGVRMISGTVRGNVFAMPYVSGTPANDHFRELLVRDKETFLQRLDEFWDIILHSSEHAMPEEIDWERFEPGWEKRKKDDPNKDKWKELARTCGDGPDGPGVIMKRGYLDLVSLNCFYMEETFVFYDQELYLENVPARAILLRTIEFIYKFNDQLDTVIPRNELFERYGIMEHMGLYQRFVSKFLKVLRDDDGLSDYFREGRREYDVVMANRERINYSGEGYAMIFKDIFHHTKGRRLYLFGAGRYARRFRERYDALFPPAGYLDNDQSRWGTEVDGLPVLSPASLKEMNPAEYKVMICIREYMPVVRQMKKEGIPNFSVYDPGKTYRADPADRGGRGRSVDGPTKKYDVGYVAGVFDMFHIGHLNLLRRAKEQCNYLIVGVVTDEGVIKHKRSCTRIPYEERLAIVQACRYVDEAVEIPLDQGDTDEAYRRYHFDAQFSGSDYADDPKWQAKREFLQRHGADLVFFPYTEGISSTQLKDMADNFRLAKSDLMFRGTQS